MVAGRQIALRADAPADHTLALGWLERQQDLVFDLGDGRTAIPCPADRSAIYVNPTSSDLWMRQGGALGILFVICPYTRMIEILGLMPGTFERAVQPLLSRLHFTTFERQWVNAIWSVADKGDAADILFVEQAFLTIAQSVLRAARLLRETSLLLQSMS
ncbi:hypothetical protein jaqu_33390 [Jannaschia aquimarina]|uniref:Uncharacterized protein n=2 Tax=Jannaschia aquimarina TaxID=935700 RepID=A0A0D1D4L1_9RHOB|nr:hypothetical protein jaqu_33390 [Jannaschia aquimarina]SNS61947.1 hypothetical protein SAMN05421775_101665 [Jannaschia aquimarina]